VPLTGSIIAHLQVEHAQFHSAGGLKQVAGAGRAGVAALSDRYARAATQTPSLPRGFDELDARAFEPRAGRNAVERKRSAATSTPASCPTSRRNSSTRAKPSRCAQSSTSCNTPPARLASCMVRRQRKVQAAKWPASSKPPPASKAPPKPVTAIWRLRSVNQCCTPRPTAMPTACKAAVASMMPKA